MSYFVRISTTHSLKERKRDSFFVLVVICNEYENKILYVMVFSFYVYEINLSYLSTTCLTFFYICLSPTKTSYIMTFFLLCTICWSRQAHCYNCKLCVKKKRSKCFSDHICAGVVFQTNFNQNSPKDKEENN